ncbi:hypothetical protein V6Z12_D11G302700 [Gossypium hirsutum]
MSFLSRVGSRNIKDVKGKRNLVTKIEWGKKELQSCSPSFCLLEKDMVVSSRIVQK